MLFLLITFIPFIQSETGNPYTNIHIMDMKFHEWKPDMLDRIEKILDADLKYADEKKGVGCESIDFEQAIGYPKQNARFLDLNIRGKCTDKEGKQHAIEKQLFYNAILLHKVQIGNVLHSPIYSMDSVRVYDRNSNQLNVIIIPVSIGFVCFLFILTFFLRRMRIAQKHRHIVSELQKKKEANAKKAQTIANIDPHANDKQRLLQPDPTVVGNVSETMGSPKEFTHEQHATPTRTNVISPSDYRFSNREYQGVGSSAALPSPPPPIPSKENRAPYHNREDDMASQTQRPLKGTRERMPVPYVSETGFPSNQSQQRYETQYPEMVSMHEQNPRVVVRSVRDDETYPNYHQGSHGESSKTFVSIPVQIEHSSSHQRYVPPPYHSDPYYPQINP